MVSRGGRMLRRIGAGAAGVTLAAALAFGGHAVVERGVFDDLTPRAVWEQVWRVLTHTDDRASAPAGSATEACTPAELVALARAYAGADAVVVGDGVPDFSADELEAAAMCFEAYGELDALGRCTVCTASVGPQTMPTSERGAIGGVRPSGWQSTRYDDLIEGRYLFNRCHLVAYALTAENDTPQNLITGTAHLNRALMLPREVAVARYVEKTGNHVLYRATPVFNGDELVCRAVRIEALSVEDDGAGVCMDVLLYNVQPGVGIDYATGMSWRTGAEAGTSEPDGGATSVPDAADAGAGDPTAATGADVQGSALAVDMEGAVAYEGAVPEVAGVSGTQGFSAGSAVEGDDGGDATSGLDAVSAGDGLGAAGASGFSRDGLVLPARVALAKAKFVVNVNSSRFHTPSCTWATQMAPRNARLDERRLRRARRGGLHALHLVFVGCVRRTRSVFWSISVPADLGRAVRTQ